MMSGEFIPCASEQDNNFVALCELSPFLRAVRMVNRENSVEYLTKKIVYDNVGNMRNWWHNGHEFVGCTKQFREESDKREDSCQDIDFCDDFIEIVSAKITKFVKTAFGKKKLIHNKKWVTDLKVRVTELDQLLSLGRGIFFGTSAISPEFLQIRRSSTVLEPCVSGSVMGVISDNSHGTCRIAVSEGDYSGLSKKAAIQQLTSIPWIASIIENATNNPKFIFDYGLIIPNWDIEFCKLGPLLNAAYETGYNNTLEYNIEKTIHSNMLSIQEKGIEIEEAKTLCYDWHYSNLITKEDKAFIKEVSLGIDSLLVDLYAGKIKESSLERKLDEACLLSRVLDEFIWGITKCAPHMSAAIVNLDFDVYYRIKKGGVVLTVENESKIR